ncbi:MAG: tyrosine--tRNA ligase [bacterium]|nr:tyrosine--tRNA ligase [bacterium]
MKEKNKKSRGSIAKEILFYVSEIIDEKSFSKRLRGSRLRVKFGIDPTSPDLHIGHIIPLRMLRRFQDMGHDAVLVIGDFTGMIGDPSERGNVRQVLTEKEVRDNMKKYVVQASRILDIKKCEIHYNGEWFFKKKFSFFADMFSKFTVQRVLERDDFQKRLQAGSDISVLEILYPLFQGYDSVAVKADIEIGGTDQKFNLLMGRKMQRRFGMPEQDIITLPLLIGTDGIKKMSKSFGNSINFSDTPNDIFGKGMSIPDNLLSSYYKLVDENFSEEKPPMESKKRLAFLLTELLSDKRKAEQAKKYFEDAFQKGKPRDLRDIAVHSMGDTGKAIGMSQSELRRLIKQGAVEFEGEKISSFSFEYPKDGVLRIGKKTFFQVKRKK